MELAGVADAGRGQLYGLPLEPDRWPWYTDIAPISWLTTRDVDNGRAKLNFSEWQRPQEADLQEVVDAIRGKDMPPLQYRLVHSAGRPADAILERQVAGGGAQSMSWTADPLGQAAVESRSPVRRVRTQSGRSRSR